MCSVLQEQQGGPHEGSGKIARSQNKNDLAGHCNIFGFYAKCVEKALK